MAMQELLQQKNPSKEKLLEELLRKQQDDIVFHPASTVIEPAKRQCPNDPYRERDKNRID